MPPCCRAGERQAGSPRCGSTQSSRPAAPPTSPRDAGAARRDRAADGDERRADRQLDEAIASHEAALGIAGGATEILPVCETALGVADVRAIARATARIRCALLGAEDLAADLCAERQPDATELDHARRRFLLDCRAAGVEPSDAPCTFSDVEGAVREARDARRLGYRSKSLAAPTRTRVE